MSVITSLQNQRVKDAVKLRQSRARQKQGRFIIDGVREISRAIAGGIELVDVFVCREFCESQDSRDALAKLEETGTEILDVAPEVFEKLAFGERTEGIVAVAVTPRQSLAELRLPDDPLIVVLEGVEKPGNIGAVIRSADGAGASAVIVADAGTDLYNPNTIRASLGAIFSLPICAADAALVRRWLVDQNIQLFCARVDAATSYSDVDLSQAAAIVLGSEAEGLSNAWGGPGVTAIQLPMLGTVDSLNVSAAAAVMLYEARRQRDAKDRRAGDGR